MALKYLYTKLASSGYSPGEIEYSLSEILQHKKPGLLDKSDLNILVSMLEERIKQERALKNNSPLTSYKYYF